MTKERQEEELQAQMFQWHWNTYPYLRRTLFHVQQKARNKIEGSRFKAIGVVKGVSDLILVCPGKTLYVEVKLPDGTQKEEQKEFQERVEMFGHGYRIVRSLEAFQALVKSEQLDPFNRGWT